MNMSRRSAYVVNLACFLLALVTIAVVVNYFAHRSEFRMRLDATKTRAYSLSPQTQQLLTQLNADHSNADGVERAARTIALVQVEEMTDASTREQVREVLDRYQQASPAISVMTVDPTDPAAIARYEGLLAKLRALEHEAIAAYEDALDAGSAAFSELQLFAQQQAAQLDTALGLLEADGPGRRELEQRVGLLALLGAEGGKVLASVRTARQESETQPIPDYETARSILAQALGQWSDELYAMTGLYKSWREDPSVNPVLARFGAAAQDDYQAFAQRLAIAADPLTQLPPLEVSSIGRQLQEGEAAVIIGPERAAVIPSAQLFPKMNLRTVGEEGVAFDRRFRGEQVISAAIRSLRVAHMPMVVFMHTGEKTLLRETPSHQDLAGVASTLDVSRFDVREWSVVQTERPAPLPNQPAVWVVVLPTSRSGLEPSSEELALLRATEALIADGEAVMLNVYPSLRPRYRMQDPWASMVASFNLTPDSAQVVFDAIEVADGELTYQPAQTIQDFPHPHAIGRAVNGQQTYLPLPVPIRPLDATHTGVTHSLIASIEPDGQRWLEADWAEKMKGRQTPVRGEAMTERVPVVVAAERPHPATDRPQRCIVVGSGGWLLSSVADVLVPIGGGRVALENPGNQELLLASVSWLAGFDDLIAPSPVSQTVARLDGVDRSAQACWALLAVIGLPLGCLAFGSGVWFMRRGA